MLNLTKLIIGSNKGQSESIPSLNRILLYQHTKAGQLYWISSKEVTTFGSRSKKIR